MFYKYLHLHKEADSMWLFFLQPQYIVVNLDLFFVKPQCFALSAQR